MAVVGDILQNKDSAIITTAPTISLLNAVRLMIEKKVGALLVMEKDKIAGIFTERDFLRASLHPDRTLIELTVAEFMTTDLVYVTLEHNLDECLSIMTTKRCRHLPVMDQGKLVGLISIGDIGKWISGERAAELQYLKEYIQIRW